MNIASIQRLGRPHNVNQNSHEPRPGRPIKVSFIHPNDKMLVWRNRFNLKGSRIVIEEVIEKRRQLTPIAFEARRQNLRAHVQSDKLIVDNKAYTTETLNELPESLKDISMSCSQNDTMLAFFRKYNPLSNHSHAPFELEENLQLQ